MHVAILGAGFAGLSTAWHLLEGGAEVTVFDPKGIGGGASGIAAGLLHPYVGEQGRRTLFATEGMKASEFLFEVAQAHTEKKVVLSRGIVRYTQEQEQEETFTSHIAAHGDVARVGDHQFLITSGMTVDCSAYLEGLWHAARKRGAHLVEKAMTSLSQLGEYDQIVIAAGAGVWQLEECQGLPISAIKGQVLECKVPEQIPPFSQSCICKGYLAVSDRERICYIGSTYERQDLSEEAQPERVKRELFPKIALFFPEVEQLEVVGCKAAIRVGKKGHYAPTVKRVRPGVWVFTGLGSRGLLYHAYCGNFLARAILSNEEESIPHIFREG
ncbi:MAG: FAD-binding oxidoreductase [Chlamydiota bacterium]